VFAFWRKTVGVRFPLVLAITAAAWIWLLQSGERTIFVGVIGTVLFFGFAFVIAIYFIHYSNSIKKLRQMNPPEARVQLSDVGISVISTLGSAQFPWSSFTELAQYPTFWILFLSKSQYMVLPIESLPGNALDYIKAQITSTSAVAV